MTTQTKKPSMASQLFQIVIWGIVIFLAYKVLTFFWSLDAPRDECGGGASMAQVMAQNFVKKDLKSPSTAKFPSFGAVESFKECTYRVTGAVDAQNSFGATVRTDYQITLRYDADRKTWVKK